MSNKILSILQQYKPSAVEINPSTFTAILVGDKRTKVELYETANLKEFKKVAKSLYQLTNTQEKEDGSEVLYFDWTIETPAFNAPIGDKFVTEIDDALIEELPSLNESLEYLANEIQLGGLFGITITSLGGIIRDSTVDDSSAQKNYASVLHNHYSQKEHVSNGLFEASEVINGGRYHLVFNSFGDEQIVNCSRHITSNKPYSMGISGDMSERIKMMKNGIIACSIHKNIGLDYVINMLQKVDPNIKKLSCSIGPLFRTYKNIPTTNSMNTKGSIIGSHYKYVFVDSRVDHDLSDLLELVFNGKLVIVGYESDSLYGNLINLMNEGDGTETETNKILTSTIGFVHPKITFSHGKISLEDSESATLNPTRVKTLFKGDISREMFNTYIDYPCKVYSLSITDGISTFTTQKEEFDALLTHAVSLGASDIHIAVNAPPKLRIQGALMEPFPNARVTPAIMKQLVSTIVTTEISQKELMDKKQVGISYAVHGLGRFRVQIITQRGTYAIAIRHTPHVVPSRDFLKIPDAIYDVVKNNPKGLVLVTGATSNGKSTTVASLLDMLSEDKPYAITSLSEPIEYLIQHKKSIVTQRELPSDVLNYNEGIKAVFRFDPDIIEVTEIRDSESISAILRFANSGHLAFTSFHTDSVLATFDGIANRIDANRREEMIATLASSVLVVINQILIPDVNGKYVAVFEYLIPDPLVRTYIKEQNKSAIESIMKGASLTSKDSLGSWMDYELIKKFEDGFISKETLMKYLRDKNSVEMYNSSKNHDTN